ncbi:MAG: tryptophan 7-halogenase [Myxococcales bacterium]|nr:tryptophan 7-halogenase [Myxococcales bacterium]
MAPIDVAIVGAGPAGSTAANLLARRGHRVVVFDRERFPRFHIGESLLPVSLPILELLGVELDSSRYQHKQGAEFIDEASGESASFDFAEALPGTARHAYQVERSRFDFELLQQAEARGAELRMGVLVEGVDIDDDGVELRADGQVVCARYLIDASGQDAMLGRARRSIEGHRGYGRAAVFAHYQGLGDAAVARIGALGNIRILMVEDGWLWLIPLCDRSLSVGLVKRRGKMGLEAFEAAVAASELVGELTAGSARTAPRIVRNFSYRNRTPSGARSVCIGDAACFLDPVFSSGVALAMVGAVRAAELLDPALRAQREHEPELMAPLSEHMQLAYGSVGALIDRFYNTRMVHNLFFAPRPDPELRAGLISMLAGDLWRSDNRFHDTLLRSVRRRG